MSAPIFNKIAVPRIGYNRFDMSHDIKMSFNMGGLYPTCVMEVLPGDVWTIKCENMLRFAPLVAPVMHRVYVTTDLYFCANRNLWPEFTDWIAGNLDESVEPPSMRNLPNAEVGDLADYLGYPTTTLATNLDVSPLPVAAYLQIWDEYYRDENLQAEVFQQLNSGLNSWIEAFAYDSVLPRAWMHDYLTSCLPWPQKGDAVTLPLITPGAADVTLKDNPGSDTYFTPLVRNSVSGAASNWNVSAVGAAVTGELNNAGVRMTIDPNQAWEVDLQAQAQTITALRTAFAAQEWLERNARGGTRYKEFLKSHFDVEGGDPRLDRPEFIGRYKQTMVISEVLSTAQTVDQSSADVPIGQMAGHGISVGGSQSMKYHAKEHGWIIGVINVQPVTAYQQGIHRSLSRTDKFDYFFGTFQHIGEQAVLNKEVYVDTGTVTALNSEFGYIPRYAEYKYMNSRVAGEFKTTLDEWHLGRKFTGAPALNSQFIESNPSRRIFATTDPNVDTIYGQIYVKAEALRKIAKYGVPTI